MTNKKIHNILTYCIAAVWLLNGLICKVLNFVPRHEQIVARILGNNHSRILIVIIGVSEISMSIWIVSKIKSRINAIAQIAIVATMNTLEFILAPDLLLWGRWNAAFAFVLILVIYFNEFYFNRKPVE